MRILDRYILKEYIRTFLIIVASFTVLFTTIQVVDSLPKLLKKNAELQYIIQYFILKLPYLTVLTSPIAVLLSGLFLMSNLSKHQESIAIRAAGISIFRMVLPLFFLGFFYSIGIGLFAEYILPKAEYKRNFIYRVKIKKQTMNERTMNSDINFLGGKNKLYSVGFFDGIRNQLRSNIDITTFDPKNGLILEQVTAKSAIWKDSLWVLQNGAIRKFENNSLKSCDTFKERPYTDFNINPKDFMKTSKDPMQMNFFELSDYINRMKKIGEKYNKEQVDLYTKIFFPFSNLIILFFCVPLASASVRTKGRGIIFLLGIVVCFIFLMLTQIFQILGYNSVISPLNAALLPNIIFLIIGIGFLVKSEK